MVKKQVTIFILTLLVSIWVFPAVHSQGVTYYTLGGVNEALNEAARSQKILIVECFAPWNYKSKWTHNMINNSRTVIDLLNERYVVFQYDTSTDEGASFANNYEVTDYPTLIAFNANGQVINKITKAMDPDDFIEYLEQMQFSTDGGAMWRLQQINTAAENNRPEEVQSLFAALRNRYADKLFTKPFWALFSSNLITYYYSPTFGFLLDNRFNFYETLGRETVDTRLREVLEKAIITYLVSPERADTVIINDIMEIGRRCELDLEICELARAMIYARLSGDVTSYLLLYPKLRDRLTEDMGFALSLTLDFVSVMGVKEQVTMAKKYIEQQMQATAIPSQIELLQTMVSKF